MWPMVILNMNMTCSKITDALCQPHNQVQTVRHKHSNLRECTERRNKEMDVTKRTKINKQKQKMAARCGGCTYHRLSTKDMSGK
jgi:hypothetical protein